MRKVISFIHFFFLDGDFLQSLSHPKMVEQNTTTSTTGSPTSTTFSAKVKKYLPVCIIIAITFFLVDFDSQVTQSLSTSTTVRKNNDGVIVQKEQKEDGLLPSSVQGQGNNVKGQQPADQPTDQLLYRYRNKFHHR